MDGTLIDSGPSILGTLEIVFSEARINATRPFDEELIGPPLEIIVRTLLLPEHKEKEKSLIAAFKQKYDTTGYKNTRLYDGVTSMLNSLTAAGMLLSVATNKRILPTNKILSNLKLDYYFQGIYALDFFNPPMSNKSQMLKELKILFNNDCCIYVGDRDEDAFASKVANIPFIKAGWGYEEKINKIENRINFTEQLTIEYIHDVLMKLNVPLKRTKVM